MTNDLISREGLFHKMEEAPWYNNADRDEIAEELVLDAPAVDAVPVVRGEWDDSLDGITPYCSICGQSHRLMTRAPNFCPNCGAAMTDEAIEIIKKRSGGKNAAD